MGLAGPLAAIKLTPAKKLADLTAPRWLGKVAAETWDENKDWLVENGLLTVQTSESYAILCDLVGKLREASMSENVKEYMLFHKAYLPLAKLFRLVPVDKPGKPEQRHETKKGLNFE